MKKIRSLCIIILFGVALCSSVIVSANSDKVDDQVEITVTNIQKEIDNIMALDEKELFYEPGFSEDGKQAYTNRDGDCYYFGDTGELVRYTSSEESSMGNGIKVNEEEVKKAAEVYLENLVEDASYYHFESIDYNEYVYAYSVMYAHEINGITTNDIVFLGINNDLDLITFSLPRPYAFQNIENLQIDQEKIKSEALDTFRKESGENSNKAQVVGISIVEDKDGKMVYQVEVKSSYVMDGETMENLDYVYIPI